MWQVLRVWDIIACATQCSCAHAARATRTQDTVHHLRRVLPQLRLAVVHRIPQHEPAQHSSSVRPARVHEERDRLAQPAPLAVVAVRAADKTRVRHVHVRELVNGQHSVEVRGARGAIARRRRAPHAARGSDSTLGSGRCCCRCCCCRRGVVVAPVCTPSPHTTPASAPEHRKGEGGGGGGSRVFRDDVSCVREGGSFLPLGTLRLSIAHAIASRRTFSPSNTSAVYRLERAQHCSGALACQPVWCFVFLSALRVGPLIFCWR
jgi:hypothetical protein